MNQWSHQSQQLDMDATEAVVAERRKITFSPLKLFLTSQSSTTEAYLLGFRGILALETLLYMFLITFIPHTVTGSGNTHGPFWQTVLRKSLSVLFWNPKLLYSTAIFLSARTIAMPFMKAPSRQTAAAMIFKRAFRLFIPVAIAWCINALLQRCLGLDYIQLFISRTGTESLNLPLAVDSVPIFFNGLFSLFWTTHPYYDQGGNKAYPLQTLYLVSIIFQESYAVFSIMICVPYTRPAWRRKMFLPILTSAWW
jgi:hypothetical protein